MTMALITRTLQDGKSYTFQLTLDALTNSDYGIFPPYVDLMGVSRQPWQSEFKYGSHGYSTFLITPQSFVSEVNATGEAQTSCVPPDVVRRVIAAALSISAGGGPRTSINAALGQFGRPDDYPETIDVADTLVRTQLNRSVDFLAAEIVQAALDAG